MLRPEMQIELRDFVGETDQLVAAVIVRQLRADATLFGPQLFNVAHRVVDGAKLPFELGEEVELIDDEFFRVLLELADLPFPVQSHVSDFRNPFACIQVQPPRPQR